MDHTSYRQFLVDLDSTVYSREAVVIDIRHNGGGSVATLLLDILMRQTTVLRRYRDERLVDGGRSHGNRVLGKPTILVQNESSVSNAEVFSEGYRRMQFGTIIGRPSAGDVIGTSSVELLDGSRFRLPMVQSLSLDGKDLEGNRRPVDIDVPLSIGARAAGSDPQLDVAISTLLAQIDAAL